MYNIYRYVAYYRKQNYSSAISNYQFSDNQKGENAMFVRFIRWWKKRHLRRANRRLKYHYEQVRKYSSMLFEHISQDDQKCLEIILVKLPKSVEKISLTLRCGDYYSYVNSRQWSDFLSRIDELDFCYGENILTNKPLPSKNDIMPFIYMLTCLIGMHTSFLHIYQQNNRYAIF